MYNEKDRNEVFKSLVNNKSWYSGRFQENDYKIYMKRRIAVEDMLFDDFQKKYWILPSKTPVYFYIIPNYSIENIFQELEERVQCGETKASFFITTLEKISNHNNISFTIHDSFRSYRERLKKKNIPVWNPSKHPDKLENYGEIFHISELNRIYEKYKELKNLRFEVQIWDINIVNTQNLRRFFKKSIYKSDMLMQRKIKNH
jgi:hypothetical protein